MRTILDMELEEAVYTEEKYALFKAYQRTIHSDDTTRSGFKRFLCESPFPSKHQMYRLDGKLIAMGVLDILPGCVSSVYFMYDPEYSKLSLGRLGACREIELAQSLESEYYMGFYIPDCPKMRYKGEYKPSYLKDPLQDAWNNLDEIEFVDNWFSHTTGEADGTDLSVLLPDAVYV